MTSQEVILARILRKRPKAQGLLFLDILVSEREPREAELVLAADFAGKAISHSGDVLSIERVVSYKALIHAGDAVRATGAWRKPPGDRDGLAFYADGLEVIEKHAEVHGESTTFAWAAPHYGQGASREQPAVVLQCLGPLAVRLAEYCREVYPEALCGVAAQQHRSPDRALLVLPPPALDPASFVRSLALDANVQNVRALRRAFITETRAHLTMADAIARLLESVIEQGLECRPRVQVYPRYLEQHVVQAFERASQPLACSGFTHVASLVWVGGMYAVGVTERSALVTEEAVGLDLFRAMEQSKAPASRAYCKLSEALARSGWAAEVASLDGLSLGVDVGASPGGWSVCLESVWRCREVWAVDPAELAPGLGGGIRHLAMRWQEALAELRANARAIDVLVCDANMPCEQTLDMLECAAAMLAPRAFIVLTFKNTCKSQKSFDVLKSQQLERLRKRCTGVREVQLLANRKETTVLARFAG